MMILNKAQLHSGLLKLRSVLPFGSHFMVNLRMKNGSRKNHDVFGTIHNGLNSHMMA
jgi:hypothetical protein